ncbi:MAG: DUF4345 family protein [Armatimonadota bacterium]
MEMLALVGATLTAGLGVLGLVAPRVAGRLVGLAPTGPRGLSELRATYGGLFLAMGTACLVLRHPAAFAVAAAAWIGAALARCISLVIDRDRSRENLGGVCLEGAMGWLLATGAC